MLVKSQVKPVDFPSWKAHNRSMTTTYTFQPVGLDLFDPRPFHPAPGQRVVLTQPHGCPRNGTMGFVYVADATTGKFHGLVRKSSLVKVAK